MVLLTKLAGIIAFAAAVGAVPVTGRTEHAMEMAPSDMKMEESSMKMEDMKMEDMKMADEMKMEGEMKMESSTMAEMAHETTTEEMKMEHTTTEEMKMEHTTTTEAAKETSVMYGSGSWDKSGYNDCVSQCMAKFGGGSANTYEMGNQGGETAGSVGEGATHTVIVAPQQGVLRYVPPFIDANVGDTIMFKWGANNHTVTKSSALLPCNKTADALFASGTQNKDFTFTQKVNDTEATFFYCATPGHCPKGMFGVINFQKSEGNSSAGSWISSNSSNSSAISSYMSYTSQMTSNNSVAASWGSNFDMSSLPEWATEPMMENIMYMRNVIAMNPDIVDQSGSVNMGSTAAPLMLPNDVNAVASSNGATEGTTSAETTSTQADPAAQSEGANNASGAASQPNAAGSLTSSKMVMGAAVALATFFLL